MKTAPTLTEHMVIQQIAHPEYGTWRVLNNYAADIWEIRGEAGDKVLFANELHFWEIVVAK